jgi:DnaJ-domain-containing protein 1
MILIKYDNYIDSDGRNLLQEEMIFLSTMAIIFILVYLILRTRLAFRKGKMPRFLMYSKNNEFRLYTSLCCTMVLYNKKEARKKVDQIEQHLKIQFPDIKLDVMETILMFLAKPLPHQPILVWLTKHYFPASKSLPLIQFLTQLGFRDGALNHNEFAFLKIITKGLNIDLKELNKAIEQNTPKSKQQIKKPTPKPRLSHYKTLSVPENAPWEEIKKSYRKLVKQYHPDRVINGTKAEIDNAAQKFREIQEAYDYLEKIN